MTEEQIEAERRAALSSMPAFGGGIGSPAEAVQQNPVPGIQSGQQSPLGGGMPKSSFSFGLPAATPAAGHTAASPQAGAPAAWPSLSRMQAASPDASSPVSLQISPTSVFGRLAAGGASATASPISQQVPCPLSYSWLVGCMVLTWLTNFAGVVMSALDSWLRAGSRDDFWSYHVQAAQPSNQQDASQPGDAASAKVRRSQRFGNNLGASAAFAPATMPQISAVEEDTSIMEDDGTSADWLIPTVDHVQALCQLYHPTGALI